MLSRVSVEALVLILDGAQNKLRMCKEKQAFLIKQNQNCEYKSKQISLTHQITEITPHVRIYI